MAQDGGGTGEAAMLEKRRLAQQIIEGGAQGLARSALPQVFAGHGFAGRDATCEPGIEGGRSFGGLRQEYRRQLLKMGNGGIPVLPRDAAQHRMALGVGNVRRPHPAQAVGHVTQPRNGFTTAQQRQLNDTGAGPRRLWCFTKAAQWMAQQASETLRAKISFNRVDDKVEKCRTAKADQRLTTRIIDGDVPALQGRLDAPRQIAVGRHQTGGPSGCVEALAQHEGDDGCFVVDIAGLDQFDARHGIGNDRRVAGHGVAPGVRSFGGPHDLGGQPVAWPVAGTGKRLDLAAPDAEESQQLFQGMLRMGRCNRCPTGIIHAEIESGQDDGAIGQMCDGLQQLPGGGDRSGRARRNDGHFRHGVAQTVGLVAQCQRAPGLGAHQAKTIETGGIGFARHAEELQDGLAVASRLQTIEFRDAAGIHLFGFHAVEKFRQRARQRMGLLRGRRDLLGEA